MSGAERDGEGDLRRLTAEYIAVAQQYAQLISVIVVNRVQNKEIIINYGR